MFLLVMVLLCLANDIPAISSYSSPTKPRLHTTKKGQSGNNFLWFWYPVCQFIFSKKNFVLGLFYFFTLCNTVSPQFQCQFQFSTFSSCGISQNTHQDKVPVQMDNLDTDIYFLAECHSYSRFCIV